MSFALSEGHAKAAGYPLGMLADEVQIARKRRNGFFVTEALLTQSAVASLLSEKAGKAFQKMIKGML